MTSEEMERELAKLKAIFSIISCYCAEGPEFMTKLQLCDAIQKEALKGYEICKKAISEK